MDSTLKSVFFNDKTLWTLYKLHKYTIMIEENDCIGIRSPYTNAYEWFTYNEV